MRLFKDTFLIILVIFSVNGTMIGIPESSWQKVLQVDNLAKIVPWLLVIGGSYELCIRLKNLYFPKESKDLNNRALCEFYQKKEKFLDEVASMRLHEKRIEYLEEVRRKARNSIEENKRATEIAKKETQRIQEERDKLKLKREELEREIEIMRKELEAQFGPLDSDIGRS